MPCPHCGNSSPLIETPDFVDYCRFCCRGTIKPAPPLEITDDMKQEGHVLRVKWDYFTCELCGKTDRKKHNSTRLMCKACRDSATRRLTRLSNPFYTYNDTSAIRHCDFCGREIRAGANGIKKEILLPGLALLAIGKKSVRGEKNNANK